MSAPTGSETSPVAIRPAVPADEEEIRAICWETGFLGRPVSEWIDVDPSLFTDLWLAYYLEQEPEHVWVAQEGERLVGYCTGCVDTARQHRWTRRVLLPRLARSLITGRRRLGPRTRAMLRRLIGDRLRYGFPDVPWREYPANLHYNVREGWRGHRRIVGTRLAAAFGRQLIRRGVLRFHSRMVMSPEDLDRRYRTIGRMHDARRTTIFYPADGRELLLATLVSDLAETGRRHRRFFGDLREDIERAQEARP